MFGTRLPAVLLALWAFALLSLAGCAANQPAKETWQSRLAPPATPASPIHPAQVQKALAQLPHIVQDIQARSKVPGLAVVVVHDGRLVYGQGLGVRKQGEAAMVDMDTVFQLASVSKSIGATVVAHQVSKGVIAWDTPIKTHLPWFSLADPWVSDRLTVGDLYAHKSGLPDHAGDHLEDLGYDRRQVLERLRYLPLTPFRNHYAYTNFGVTAAAEAAAVASGTDWATLSDTVLYRPLGMTSTSSRFVDFMAKSNRAVPHIMQDGVFQAVYQRQPDAQSPAGGVSSSARDMARWMTMVLGEGKIDGQQLIASPALLPALSAQVVTGEVAAPDWRPSLYGYGFNVGVDASGRTVLSHSGAFLLGAATNFLLIPSANLGIAVLTNASPTGAAEAITREFADHVEFGESTRDWLAAYAAIMADMYEPEGQWAGQPFPKGPMPSQSAAAYTGRYTNQYFGDATVEAGRDGVLWLTVGPDRFRYALQHWDGNTFVFDLTGENAPPGSRSAVEFLLDERNRASQVKVEYLDSNGWGVFHKASEARLKRS